MLFIDAVLYLIHGMDVAEKGEHGVFFFVGHERR